MRTLAGLLALCAAGCFSKPDRIGLNADASVQDTASDASAGSPTPRLIGNAYFSNAASSGLMSSTGYQIDTTGIVNGDLVLFIASVDNGSTVVWPNPIAPGFTQLTQQFYGNDGQSFVVDWKIANGEPASYVGKYGSGVGSSAATISLIAISGAKPSAPINASLATFDPGAGTMPTHGDSAGVTTTVSDCTIVYASGADWLGSPGSNTVQAPDGFTALTAIGDHGDMTWDWTSQQVAYHAQPDPGATGALLGVLNGTTSATAWTVVIAIAPR